MQMKIATFRMVKVKQTASSVGQLDGGLDYNSLYLAIVMYK